MGGLASTAVSWGSVCGCFVLGAGVVCGEDRQSQQFGLAGDLFCSCDYVVEGGCVSEEQAFCVDCLASDSFEGVYCVLACCCGEDHDLFASVVEGEYFDYVDGFLEAVVEVETRDFLHSVLFVVADGYVPCPVDLPNQYGEFRFHCVSFWSFYGHVCHSLFRPHMSQPHTQKGHVEARSSASRSCIQRFDTGMPANPRGVGPSQDPFGVSEGFGPQSVVWLLREQFCGTQNTSAAVSGDVASSQVSPVRAPQALSRSERRLDGSSGVVATPAKAGDALAASSPCNFRPQGARAIALGLSELASRTGSELLRRSSWDAAPVDAAGVPC
jgi:hypothetical protein